MIDKNFCMSSYLAFRYIEKEDVDFFEGMHHENIAPIPDEQRIIVRDSYDIDKEIKKQLEQFSNLKKGILLSGGMDSAIIASYLPNAEAYTFRFLGGEYQKEELQRAEYYAKTYNLNLHYVDINRKTVENYLDLAMETKGAPVHSIEPQIIQAALQAKKDGVEIMFVGESSDLVFGGMDGLLSKDWGFEEFVERYTFTNPMDVLVNPVDMNYLFLRYKKENNKIDFVSFLDNVFSIESSGSYFNAFKAVGMPYYDPYARLKMKNELDLDRIRRGDSKYLIRELMARKYPEMEVPNKVPMPRPVDQYFMNWDGPKRDEFKKDLDLSKFTGNQKWQLFCLERFLDNYER